MGLFSSGPSLAEIDACVDAMFQKHLGTLDQVSQGRFAVNYAAMLRELRTWSESNTLSLWKSSRITGMIEAKLRNVFPGNIVNDLMKQAHKEINNV